jgi:photosystem II stability/assembly factor-like uncharacterized protein
VNENTGYTAGNQGVLAKTTDAGLNWNLLQSGTELSLYSLCFTDELTGYATGGFYNDGTILKTTNGGLTWNTILNDATYGIFSICFPNSMTGYAAGLHGSILKTTDGGINWTSLTTNSDRDLMSVFFSSPMVGYAVGSGGTILFTKDGGDTWFFYPPVTWKWLNSVFFTEDNKGYFVGNDGTILSSPATSFVVSTPEFNMPESIFAVFPNPTENWLTIEFKDGSSNTKVEIFNLNGRQLFDEKVYSQKSTVLNLSMLTSGLYILKITTASGSECQKVLIH